MVLAPIVDRDHDGEFNILRAGGPDGGHSGTLSARHSRFASLSVGYAEPKTLHWTILDQATRRSTELQEARLRYTSFYIRRRA